MSGVRFGAFFKECRIRKGQTLRAFCEEKGFDVGNISRLERGRLAPPQSQEKLGEYAAALGLAERSDDWVTFFDLAAEARGQIPHDILSDDELVGKLPLVFRTLRGQRVDDNILEQLIDKIRKA